MTTDSQPQDLPLRASAQASAPARPGPRAVFIDVDGTYADRGLVPEEHVQAVRAAREAGHRVFLCTGRPVSMLPESILAAGFDGVVASAGAYVRVGVDVVCDRRFPATLGSRTVEVLEAHRAVYVLEAQEALYAPESALPRLTEIVRAHFRPADARGVDGSAAILGALETPRNLHGVAFAKVSVFECPVPVAVAAAEIGGGVAVVENSIADEGRHAGELYLGHITKAVGVEAVVRHLGLSAADTVAIGDGANDLEMLAYAGTAVAVDGAGPQLLALADHVVPPPAGAGVAAAFAVLGLA
ncbi:HAD family hydrolase [Sinomonas halotolerans]|uniref:HAD family hydrolase n=1 Tax=Sinomonas halotolerans TaxID=1644133 RepID=A0ABU9X126_9MICC